MSVFKSTTFKTCLLITPCLLGMSYQSHVQDRRQRREMDILLSNAGVIHFERDGKQFYYDELTGQEFEK